MFGKTETNDNIRVKNENKVYRTKSMHLPNRHQEESTAFILLIHLATPLVV